MAVSPESIATIRFGYGFSPSQDPVDRPDALIADLIASTPPPKVPELETLANLIGARRETAMAAKQARQVSPDSDPDVEAAFKAAHGKLVSLRILMTGARITAPLAAPVGFAERLVTFWADHFTARASGYILGLMVPHMIETVIRPNIARRFEDMLVGVMTHPAMLIYLDQVNSIGPASIAGQRRKRGLNENLAREILELHTLGANGPYSQTDVREFAELLTGYSFDQATGDFRFRKRMAEPGSETVLGQTYGGDPPRAGHAVALLRDLAKHPATAAHLSRKLVTHFVSDSPDPDLVAALAEEWNATGGDLQAVMGALVSHPRAWEAPLTKTRQPFDFAVASLRALGVDPATIALDPKRIRQVGGALRRMGQDLLQPPGPDGWAEEAEAWITPQGLASRIAFASKIVRTSGVQPDPRDFLTRTLHDLASPDLRFAVSAAETEHEGLALTLLSPEFNRR